MAKKPLRIDWDTVLAGMEHGPPPELEVVPSASAAAESASGDVSGEEAGLDLSELDDHQLQDKIQRMAKNLASGLEGRLPDKGVKFRARIRLMQEELDRRKLSGSRKNAGKCTRITEEKNMQSQDAVNHLKANNTVCQSLVQCSFTSKLLQKIEGKSDDGSTEELRELDQNQEEELGKSASQADEKRHQIGMSSHSAKLTSRQSSFRCVSSLANKDQQRPSNGFHKDIKTADTPFVERKSSKRRRVSESENSMGLDFKKVKEVVLLDEEEIEDVEPTQGNVSEKWKEVTVYYPSRDDPHTVELSYEDIKCLDPESYLSSTIMNFYILYLQRSQSSIGKSRGEYHFFNTYFYNKLEEAVSFKGDKTACFLKLRRWWKGVDIFQKSYIFIPIHGDLHWSLVIICILAKEEESGPIILHLDSLGIHSSHSIFDVVCSYLKEEWNYVKQSAPSNLCISERVWKHLPRRIEKKKITVPQQKNEFDCGLFVLYFMERFIEEAPERLKRKDLDMFGSKWFHPEEASGLRKQIRRLLLKLFKSSDVKNEGEESIFSGSPTKDD